LFEYLAGLCPSRELAWDVGTGNGQAAIGLAAHFRRVIATDATAAQIARARPHERIEYRVATAEAGGLSPSSADLVAVAQALHWFDLAAFYAEVRRVAAPGAVIAAWCYGLPRVDPAVDAVLEHFYHQTVGPYWAAGRRLIDERYETIPFPFEECGAGPENVTASALPPGGFRCQAEWTMGQYLDYIASWSAVAAHNQKHGGDIVGAVAEAFSVPWGGQERSRRVQWPIYLRVGRVGGR
jgi:SAM-dependent methyltransferase